MDGIIVANATACGESGIAIVRLSGDGSVALAQQLIRGTRRLSETAARTMRLYTLWDGAAPFDEALIVRFEKGASYTAEESVEIQCHGGMLPAQKCIEILCKAGARIAKPGEFTKRAFLNGRLDLAQAESVLGIIKAKSAEALAASERVLQGKFTKKISDFHSTLTTLAAKLEVNIDFPEDDTGLFTTAEIASEIASAKDTLEEMTADCRTGLILREGARVAILGKPNVGKSSLLNALLKEKRAIVTELPGTTRDKIEEDFVHKGIAVRITDTAGIRNTQDKIEAIGIETALAAMREADLTLWLLDISREFSDEDEAIFEEIKDRKHITVLNKCDLPHKLDTKLLQQIGETEILQISATSGVGTEALKDKIVDSVSQLGEISQSYAVSARQMECMTNAANALRSALSAIELQLAEDIVAENVAQARNEIAEMLGLDPTEKLLDTVFSDFCVGK